MLKKKFNHSVVEREADGDIGISRGIGRPQLEFMPHSFEGIGEEGGASSLLNARRIGQAETAFSIRTARVDGRKLWSG